MSKAIFKPYVMNQQKLMPPSYEEKIPSGHLVRQVNEAIEALDLEILLAQYEGGGTTSYHPKMMLKVLVYVYCKKIHTSRKIAEDSGSVGREHPFYVAVRETDTGFSDMKRLSRAADERSDR